MTDDPQTKKFDLIINGKLALGWRIDDLAAERVGVAFLVNPFAIVPDRNSAEAILRSVNCHDDLMAALKRIAQSGCTKGGCCSACGAGEDEACGQDCCKLIARAALAKVPET